VSYSTGIWHCLRLDFAAQSIEAFCMVNPGVISGGARPVIMAGHRQVISLISKDNQNIVVPATFSELKCFLLHQSSEYIEQSSANAMSFIQSNE